MTERHKHLAEFHASPFLAPGSLICIEGNIGVGKTTLVKRLARHFESHAVYEEFDENPWLPLFYMNPDETAFALELSFLTDRSKQLMHLPRKFSDRAVFADYCLDKCLLFTGINLSPADFARYKELHRLVSLSLATPALVIAIHSTSTELLRNIAQRGRPYEKNIETAYLDKLNLSYEYFFSTQQDYPVLNIFTEELNDEVYERIFQEIVSFLKIKPAIPNTILEL